METILFYIFALLIVASAAVVVLSKNIMHSAFSLLFTFFGIAGIYVLLYADFLAISQIMIYIGGILILIIFGVMLTSKITGVDIKTGFVGKAQYILAGIISLVIFITLSLMYYNVQWISGPIVQPVGTINMIGKELLTDYLLAFEVASVLLLVALVGAALIARRK
jgi:NADH-quinone oxidoreductase subunit J